MATLYQRFRKADTAVMEALSDLFDASMAHLEAFEEDALEEPILKMKMLEADSAYVIAKAKLNAIKWEMEHPTLEAMQADPSKLDYFANILPAYIVGNLHYLRDQRGADSLTRFCEVFKVAHPICQQLGASVSTDIADLHIHLKHIKHINQLPADIVQQARAAIGSVVTLTEGG